MAAGKNTTRGAGRQEAAAEGVLLSVQVGAVKRHVMPENARVDFHHPFWSSGIFKQPVTGPVEVSPRGVAGDAQADLENHGGPDNVVLAYDADHYPAWRGELGMPALRFGAFGENFTVRGFSDETVCIGDVWQIGEELVMQVSQPRQPCYKLARRLQQAHIVKRVHETNRGGWYLRVITAGKAEAGMRIVRSKRMHPEWTVARALAVMYGRRVEVEAARALAGVQVLSARWKQHLLDDE